MEPAIDHEVPMSTCAPELRIDPSAGVFPSDGCATAGSGHARTAGNIFSDWLDDYEKRSKSRNYGMQLVIIHDRIENVSRRIGYKHGKRLLDIWNDVAAIRSAERANAVLPNMPARIATVLSELRNSSKISPEDQASVAKDFDELFGRARAYFGVPTAQ